MPELDSKIKIYSNAATIHHRRRFDITLSCQHSNCAHLCFWEGFQVCGADSDACTKFYSAYIVICTCTRREQYISNWYCSHHQPMIEENWRERCVRRDILRNRSNQYHSFTACGSVASTFITPIPAKALGEFVGFYVLANAICLYTERLFPDVR